jgi:hypothetical protein
MPPALPTIRLAALFAAALLATACSTSTTSGATANTTDTATPVATGHAGAQSSTPPAGTTPATVTPSGCDRLAWHAAPLTVTHTPPVPPVPVVTALRTGSHPTCRYDRIVFDLNGGTPGYGVRYVSRVTADPSDRPVTVPGGGSALLLITLHPAQGHGDTGTPTIATRVAALGYPMLKGYALTGDFEGRVTIALGLSVSTVIRVGELPGRLYVDVSY